MVATIEFLDRGPGRRSGGARRLKAALETALATATTGAGHRDTLTSEALQGLPTA